LDPLALRGPGHQRQYQWLAVQVIHAPAETIGPARAGLLIMLDAPTRPVRHQSGCGLYRPVGSAHDPAAAGAVFGGLLDLVHPLPGMVWNCLFIILPVPPITVAHSYYQGSILSSRRTRSIPESVGLFLLLATGC
jgi:hypothetical protein